MTQRRLRCRASVFVVEIAACKGGTEGYRNALCLCFVVVSCFFCRFGLFLPSSSVPILDPTKLRNSPHPPLSPPPPPVSFLSPFPFSLLLCFTSREITFCCLFHVPVDREIKSPLGLEGFSEDSVTVFSHSHSSRLCEEASAHPPFPPFPLLFQTFSLPDRRGFQQGVIVYRKAASLKGVGLPAAKTSLTCFPFWLVPLLCTSYNLHQFAKAFYNSYHKGNDWIFAPIVHRSGSRDSNISQLMDYHEILMTLLLSSLCHQEIDLCCFFCEISRQLLDGLPFWFMKKIPVNNISFNPRMVKAPSR